ncbi:MAG: helicase HerA domain-containing protein [Acidimicrobiia bacterium]
METKPGQFFLGALLDDKVARGESLHYEASDLTTHGVIVGMTGSGKTGLAIDLLEEAILSGIPVLIIDPKGDMTNLLLNFPDLAPGDFRPWVDESIARREGVTPDELATRVAREWREGLNSWGIGPERMRRLKEKSAITIYTPGSNAGTPLNVLGSLEAPVGADTEAIRDEIEGYVASLLVLAGIDSDAISGPEHILLATIIENEWGNQRSLDLASLIGLVQQPPFRKLGVFELDAFIPPKNRTALAMKLNGLVASPSFAAWREGEPLDIEAMLFEGTAASAAVIYLAHLSEPERQFLVTLLFSKLVTFMRSQPGSSELRLLTYMDEVAGFAPPTAEPPSKKPIMVLAKQARAFGYGLVLTTQNPMDFDYKVMSNAGTWAIGRLQTERDKARILEAMQSAAGSVDVDLLDRQISGLGKRQFVLHTTGGKPPLLFTTRWAMSYLAGPLSKQQISQLAVGDSPEPAASTAPKGSTTDEQVVTPVAVAPAAAEDSVPVAPAVAPGVAVTYLDTAAPWATEIGAVTGSTKLAPVVAATVNLLYDDTKSSVNHTEAYEAILTDPGNPLTSESVVAVDHDPRDFRSEVPSGVSYTLTATAMDNAAFWNGIERNLTAHLVSSRKLQIWKNPGLKLYSRVGERESDFRARCISAAGEEVDKAISGLREKYGARIDRVRDQLATAQRRMSDLDADVAARRQQEVVSGAGDLLGALLGGRRRSSISQAASRRSQTRRTEARRDSAAGAIADKQSDLEALEDDLAAEIDAIRAEWDDRAAHVEELEIALEKVDVQVSELKLVWVPSD